MTTELNDFAARVREFLADFAGKLHSPDLVEETEPRFGVLAQELFRLQFAANPAYRRFCETRRAIPDNVHAWRSVPAIPTAAFKELELTCLPPAERTQVFHSSGTTEQQPSRQFHNATSLDLYEASLWSWFAAYLLEEPRDGPSPALLLLTPPPVQAPHSSLVHMFETLRRRLGAEPSAFLGTVDGDGGWIIDARLATAALADAARANRPVVLLGTAFNFVHLLDGLISAGRRCVLPGGSRIMETGGYKGRSRSLPRAELHALITERLGVPPSRIVCEYGMSELSSQAYDRVAGDEWQVTSSALGSCHIPPVTRHLHFPPWARAQIISPETGREVADGETGLIRVCDLANVFSVMAIQTEDLGIRRGHGFELLGRAPEAGPRGCSLMVP